MVAMDPGLARPDALPIGGGFSSRVGLDGFGPCSRICFFRCGRSFHVSGLLRRPFCVLIFKGLPPRRNPLPGSAGANGAAMSTEATNMLGGNRHGDGHVEL